MTREKAFTASSGLAALAILLALLGLGAWLGVLAISAQSGRLGWASGIVLAADVLGWLGLVIINPNEGRVVHQWKSAYEPGQSAYLLPNGHLVRAAMLKVQGGTGGGEGGRIEEYDWDGNLVWEFNHATREHLTWIQRWQLGDLIVWDNRCTLHRRAGFAGHGLRRLHRLMTKGERPV